MRSLLTRVLSFRNIEKPIELNIKWLFSISFLLLFFASIPANAQNPIPTENAKQGNPASEWDVSVPADPTIEGFGTEFSVNKGETIHFKINTDASAYSLKVYRIGYYQGNGARLMGNGIVTAKLPQVQPAPITDQATGLIDCGNWAESAHWDVPSTAVSGVYIVKLVRADNGGANQMIFIVRDDASTSDLYFKTSDQTWQAYNQYGGNSLYGGNTTYPEGHATKVSYNRPFITRGGGHGTDKFADFFFNAEYPMIRWLERNGYNVTYTSSLDADRRGNLIKNHKVFLSVGHDEYWSAGERSYVEAARNAGVNLAFFSGNEMYWKTRWENSIDGTGTPYRTLVCYKEGTEGERACGGKCDPLSNVWTGIWKSGCDYPSADGCQPENILTGQRSWYSSYPAIALQVPDTYKNLRFWRNTTLTSIAAGTTATLANGTLGFEIDYEQKDAVYPPGRITLTETTVNTNVVHKMSIYKHSSGALVFGAGTIQWSWGLDGTHDGYTSSIPDLRMQQATVNLLADMNAQPSSLQTDLIAAAASTDKIAPVSIITSPIANSPLNAGKAITLSGTASDVGGVVAGVEISLDGGATWQVVTGTKNWSFNWIPTNLGNFTIKVRSFDDSGNIEGTSTSSNSVAVVVSAYACPCTLFQPTDVPDLPLSTNSQPLEIGFKFRSNQSGTIDGIRFYKGQGTTGVHSGHLWTSTGTLLATVTFTSEGASGWQQAIFSSPVAISANTTYVASILSPDGHFAVTDPYFTQSIQNGPLTGLGNGVDGPNGLYSYSATPVFPTSNYESSNYWVDVVFNTTSTTSPVAITSQPISTSICAGSNVSFNAAATGTPTPTVQWQSTVDGINWANITGATSPTLSLVPVVGDNGKQYRAIFTNTSGSVNSSPAILTVNQVVASLTKKADASCGLNNGSIVATATGGTSPFSYSINGGTQQSDGTFNNLASGSYSITISDSKGCSANISAITIIAASSLTATASKTDETCLGLDGSITINTTGGTSPYTYSLKGGAFQSGNIFTKLSAGSYDVTVKDAKGCTAVVQAITISKTSAIVPAITTKTDGTCGGAGGLIAVSASGGIAPYSYSLNGATFQSSNTFTNLGAGVYTVTIKDSKGCTSTISAIAIAQISKVVATVSSKTDETCRGNDGSISILASGGVIPYQYSINGGTYQSSNTFSNLSDGSYTITVKDAKGCTSSTSSIVIASGNTIKATVAAETNESCSGNDGTIKINSTGGTGQYYYTLDSANFQTTSTFTGLSAGSYNVTVVDTKFCVTVVNGITIQQLNTVDVAVANKTNPSCKNNDGSIVVTASGGVAPYVYSLNGGSYQSSNTFFNLAGGVYKVTAKDSKGCTATESSINISAVNTVSTNVKSKTSVSCKGKDGSITLAVSGGSSPYTFSLNGGSFATYSNNIFSNLNAGTYSITAKDSKGCTSSISGIIVSNAAKLSLSVVGKANACRNLNNGSISLDGSGGIEPYQYSLNNGPYKSDSTFDNLAPSTYYVTIKDAKGCTSVLSGIYISRTNQYCSSAPKAALNNVTPATVNTETASATDNNNCNLKVNLTPKNPLCFNTLTGSIVSDVSGNTGHVVYMWSNGSTGSNLNNVGEGEYSLKITDKETGCTVNTERVKLTNPSKMLATINSEFTNGYNVKCKDGKTGNINVNVEGGIGTYAYEWSNGATTKALEGVSAGDYKVTIKDEVKCPVQLKITLIEPDSKMEIVPTVKHIDCNNSKGAIELDASGGVAPYSFSWNSGSSSKNISGLSAAKYSVMIKDAVGCEVSKDFEIEDKSLNVELFSSGKTINPATHDTAIKLIAQVSGGNGEYRYSWLPSDTIAWSESKTFFASPANTTDYSIIVKDIAGCTTSATVMVHGLADSKKGNRASFTTNLSNPEIKILPNPSNGNFNVVLNGLDFGKADIVVLDERGKEVARKNVIVSSSEQTVAFSLQNLSRGLYFINVVSDKVSLKEKVVIK